MTIQKSIVASSYLQQTCFLNCFLCCSYKQDGNFPKYLIKSCFLKVHNGVDVISILRNGSAAVKAAALMKERGYTNRRSRHRLTPGTVKFAAFYVLSLEGSRGLTILEVAEKIQVYLHQTNF
jgi:hypothetical protein